MKIQSIQNNNTNFQGLYADKRVMKHLTPEFLQGTDIKECADRFEVLVTEKGGGSFLDKMLGNVGELLFQVGEKVKQTKNGNVEFVGQKTHQYNIEELKNGSRLKPILADQIEDNSSQEDITQYVIDGKLDLLDCHSYIIAGRLSPENYDKAMKAFVKQQLTQDKDGNLPLHKIDDAEYAYRLHNYLEKYPEDLAEIYLTKNNKGDLPIHNSVIMNTTVLYDLWMALKKYPRAFVTIFEAKSHDGMSAMDYLTKYSPLDNTSIHLAKLVTDAKQDCINARGKFVPAVAKSETETLNRINKELKINANYDSIMNTLANPLITQNNGKNLNLTNNISQIIDFMLENATKEEKSKIISELKKLTNINYNKLDDNGISVMEKVMNAEDFELLDLLKDKKLNYYRGLDYAFNRIENPEFKSRVQDLNFEFKNLEDSVKTFSMRAIEKYEANFDSPLYHKNYNGKKLYKLASEAHNSFFLLEFRINYSKYLPDNII